MAQKVKVGVLRGGASEEYDISLQTGARILRELYESPRLARYEPVDLFIDRDGNLFADGLPINPQRLVRRVDVIFNALHGAFGEDGKLQQLLDQLQMPYTGSGALGSAVGMNKQLAKDVMRRCGVSVPQHVLLPPYRSDTDGRIDQYAAKKAQEIFQQVAPPWIMKPLTGGSSFGVRVVKTYYDLVDAIHDAAKVDRSFIVEELIPGKEATCGVIEKFRDQDLYPLIPSQIQSSPSGFHDWEGKYTSQATELERTPGAFSKEEMEQLQELAVAIHRELGLRHYSRSDFMIKNGKVYALEVNSLPGLTDYSLLPQGLEGIGSSMDEFIDHILSLALGEK